MQMTNAMTLWLAQAGGETGAVSNSAPSSHDTLGTGAPTAAGAAGTGAPLGGAGQGGGAPPTPFGGNFMWILILMMVGVIFISSMSGRKERKRRAELMSNLKRGDQVVTAGGIIGSVAELRDDEIVLVTDEHSRTRLRVTRNSIQQVLGSPSGSVAKSGSTDADIQVKTKAEKATV